MNEEIPSSHLWESLKVVTDKRIVKLHKAAMLLATWGLIEVTQARDIFEKIEKWSDNSN